MAKPKSIDIEVEEVRQRIPLNFGADHYLILPPKAAGSLELALRAQKSMDSEDIQAMWDEVLTWFRDGLSKKEFGRLEGRLNDPKDPLDMTHLIQAMQGLVEVMVDNTPTSSSSD